MSEHTLEGKLVKFSEETTIHGFPLIFARKRHILERLLWVIIFMVAASAAIYLAFNNLDHYNANPTVVSIRKDFRNWMNPLPAVTGCLAIRADGDLIDEVIFAKWKVNISDPKHEYYFQFLKLVTNMSFANLKEFSKFENDASLNNEDLLVLADKVHPRISGVLVTSETEGTIKNGLTYIYSEAGICFTINSNYSKFLAYPTTLTNAPASNASTSIYCHYLNGLCYARFDNSPVSDVNYFIHSPMDTIHGTLAVSLVLHLSEELEVNFRMVETRSAQSLRNLNPSQRQCRFSEEPLQGTPFFSTSICYMECRARLSLKLCGCVPQYYHFISIGKQCDIKGLVCLSSHSKTLTEPPMKLGCNCPQPCNIVTYFSENPKSTKWKSGYFDQRMTFRWGLLPPTTRMYRDVLFSFEDLVVSIGGTVALFLGISFLSLVEIIFFVIETLISYCFPKQQNVAAMSNKVGDSYNKNKRYSNNYKSVQIAEPHKLSKINVAPFGNRANPKERIIYNNFTQQRVVDNSANYAQPQLGLLTNRQQYRTPPPNYYPNHERLAIYSHDNYSSHIPFRH